MSDLVRRLALFVLLLAGLATPHVASAEAAPDPVGAWHGALQAPQGPIMLAVNVSRAADGSLSAVIETDQGPGARVPASVMTVQGGHFSFEVAQIGASFTGNWVAADQSWEGTFKQ